MECKILLTNGYAMIVILGWKICIVLTRYKIFSRTSSLRYCQMDNIAQPVSPSFSWQSFVIMWHMEAWLFFRTGHRSHPSSRTHHLKPPIFSHTCLQKKLCESKSYSVNLHSEVSQDVRFHRASRNVTHNQFFETRKLTLLSQLLFTSDTGEISQ